MAEMVLFLSGLGKNIYWDVKRADNAIKTVYI
jgi:hypothetical protein